jgi:hypothetical protein
MTDKQFEQTIKLLEKINRNIESIENNTVDVSEIIKLLKEIKTSKED